MTNDNLENENSFVDASNQKKLCDTKELKKKEEKIKKK